jgi:hypothetical protein
LLVRPSPDDFQSLFMLSIPFPNNLALTSAAAMLCVLEQQTDLLQDEFFATFGILWYYRMGDPR